MTYKEGEERAVQASGKNLSLFAGFRFSLDLGQVVPEELGGDLRFVVEGEKIYTQPLGKARSISSLRRWRMWCRRRRRSW